MTTSHKYRKRAEGTVAPATPGQRAPFALRAAAILATLAVAATAAADPAATRVAIVPGVAVNIGATRVDALTQDLADALNAMLVVDAVGGLHVRRQLPADLRPDCVTQPACIRSVAQATGAEQLLFVIMVDAGGDAISVDAVWADATGMTAQRQPVALTNTSDVDARTKFELAARSLLPDVPARPKPHVAFSIAGKVAPGAPRHFTKPAILTASTTVVGLSLWAGFGLEGLSKYRECERLVTEGGVCGQDLNNSIRHLNIGADVGWSLALASAIATVVLYVTSGERVRLIATPPPDGAGASVMAIGRF